MKIIISLAGALLIVALLQLSGTFANLSLSHPFWEIKATLIGAGIGVVLTLILFVTANRFQQILPMLTTLIIILLVICTGITWYFARIFINSEVFEPLAGQIWFFSYHGLVALIVPAVAVLIKRLLQQRQT